MLPGMDVTLRPIGPEDRALVLRLNHDHVDLLSPMDDDRLTVLQGWADRADVIEVDGRPAGFVLTFAPGAPYDSVNYRWHVERSGGSFYYLDRVVLAPEHRGTGAAHRAYDLLEDLARPYGRMVLEVNADPPNERSLRFHARRGYVEVGRAGEPGHVVTVLSRELDPLPTS
jgi:predicted GNAT superfamily acetyltransferase